MASDTHLLLILPSGMLIATSLGIAGFAWHRSPGSGKYFRGRTVLVDLALDAAENPAFAFLREGGWRDVERDTLMALGAVRAGKQTKTALSNAAFNSTPIDAYRGMYLAKTGGELLELVSTGTVVTYQEGECHENATPDEVATLAGLPLPERRLPRLYMVLCPTEFITMSNLTPSEYAWYVTRRSGKVFRQVMFTELTEDEGILAAQRVYDAARHALEANANKKTKTVVIGGCLNRTSFASWLGYQHPGDGQGGIYVANRERLTLWRLPAQIPRSWERAD